MPGTIRIWWHDGAAIDARNNDIPIVNEPSLGFESVSVSSTPTATGAAPKNSAVALIESDVNVRYRVRPRGDRDDADKNCKPLPATGNLVDFIGVSEGYSISFVEV